MTHQQQLTCVAREANRGYTYKQVVAPLPGIWTPVLTQLFNLLVGYGIVGGSVQGYTFNMAEEANRGY